MPHSLPRLNLSLLNYDDVDLYIWLEHFSFIKYVIYNFDRSQYRKHFADAINNIQSVWAKVEQGHCDGIGENVDATMYDEVSIYMYIYILYIIYYIYTMYGLTVSYIIKSITMTLHYFFPHIKYILYSKFRNALDIEHVLTISIMCGINSTRTL